MSEYSKTLEHSISSADAHSTNMLSRPATKISLTTDDITTYDKRKAIRESLQTKIGSQGLNRTSMEKDTSGITHSANDRAAKAKLVREQRIGVSNAGN